MSVSSDVQTGTDSGDSSLQLCKIRIAFITTYLAVGGVEGGVASDIMVTGKPWSMNTARVVVKYFAFLFAKKSHFIWTFVSFALLLYYYCVLWTLAFGGGIPCGLCGLVSKN